jgi:hypothetical protein
MNKYASRVPEHIIIFSILEVSIVAVKKTSNAARQQLTTA